MKKKYSKIRRVLFRIKIQTIKLLKKSIILSNKIKKSFVWEMNKKYSHLGVIIIIIIMSNVGVIIIIIIMNNVGVIITIIIMSIVGVITIIVGIVTWYEKNS